MGLDKFTRVELLEKAKVLQIPGVNDNTSKTTLIKKLQLVIDTNPSIVEEITSTDSTFKSTKETKPWEVYLKKLGVSSSDFLKRYPTHPFRKIIEKIK